MRTRAAVDDELEYVRASVMPRDVELPAWSRDTLGYHFRIEDLLSLAAPTRDHLAIGVHNDTVARIEPTGRRWSERRAKRQSFRYVLDSHRAAAGEHVDPPF